MEMGIYFNCIYFYILTHVIQTKTHKSLVKMMSQLLSYDLPFHMVMAIFFVCLFISFLPYTYTLMVVCHFEW